MAGQHLSEQARFRKALVERQPHGPHADPDAHADLEQLEADRAALRPRQLPQQQPAAIRSELPTVKPAHHSLPSQAPEFQSFRGTEVVPVVRTASRRHCGGIRTSSALLTKEIIREREVVSRTGRRMLGPGSNPEVRVNEKDSWVDVWTDWCWEREKKPIAAPATKKS